MPVEDRPHNKNLIGRATEYGKAGGRTPRQDSRAAARYERQLACKKGGAFQVLCLVRGCNATAESFRLMKLREQKSTSSCSCTLGDKKTLPAYIFINFNCT